MDDEIMTTTPEPSPAPDPAPAPEPSEPVTVVSVDELVDRLVQSTQEGEESVDGSEALVGEADAAPGEGDVGVVDDVVPGLIGDAVDILLGIRKGMENVESIEHVVNHPALTTPFQEYTVTEGLLLLLLLFFFLKACMDMIRRAFSWLL